MFSITFSKGKCSASLFFAKQKTQHFCNVRNAKSNVRNTFVTFCFAEHFPLENVMLNIFLWKMYAKMHFGVHFPKENVQHQIYFCKASNAFLTFDIVKCTHKKQSLAKNKAIAGSQNVSKNLNLNLLLKIIDKIFSFT